MALPAAKSHASKVPPGTDESSLHRFLDRVNAAAIHAANSVALDNYCGMIGMERPVDRSCCAANHDPRGASGSVYDPETLDGDNVASGVHFPQTATIERETDKIDTLDWG